MNVRATTRAAEGLFFPAALSLRDLKGPDAALAIEIADSSLGYDLGRKPGVYARFLIPELWVINAKTLDTHVHLNPTASGYSDVAVHAPGAVLTPLRAPELALRLSALDLGP